MERAVGAGGGRNGAWTFQSTFGFGFGGQECPPSVVRRGVFQEVWPSVVRCRGQECPHSVVRRGVFQEVWPSVVRCRGQECPRSVVRRGVSQEVWPSVVRRLVWGAPLALEAGRTERGLSSPRLDSGLVDRNVHPPLSAGACSKRSGLLWFAGRYGARRWRLVPPEGRCEDFWGVCREIIRSCEALAPLQGALMALAGYLGHRVAQPQAIFSVPVGDARVYVRRGAA
ncbi:MAG: hypothetical protein RLZZ179_297 [Verrucomicrobiota bacterium]|jgi:hypothetical protein